MPWWRWVSNRPAFSTTASANRTGSVTSTPEIAGGGGDFRADDAGRGHAQAQLQSEIVDDGGRPQGRPARLLLPGQRRPVVGKLRLVADEHDQAPASRPAQRLHRGRTAR
ncbi:hypothetical protein ACIBI9_20210 [Nonomuraea sp. NPDC050451]|uniref:hypothetical protein n=1 Tax=Nonomuraea sp. NPDC050451 TaxID=3364364 RepID=UPI0037B27205